MRSALCALALFCLSPPLAAQSIEAPLTDSPGDPERGRAIVIDQREGLCILCHPGPYGDDVPFAGNIGPDLTGVGDRLDEGRLRQRMVDSRVINPTSIMPPFHSTEGLRRVGERWQGEPILNAQQIEDVVAYLATLTEEGEVDR